YCRSIAQDHIEFLGEQSSEALVALYQEARAFVFPGEDDFGITPLEAQASGTPVIAFGAGGALETVNERT
ncbi:MAG TPA: mannosyltransferase, partial [Deltaproteobacteria bacterium]|nr:mannosyltransferase [Deltaproteobacteria bacterium]